MTFAQDNGYTPRSIPSLMDEIRLAINQQFDTDFTTETFLGTNWYKYFYTLAQRAGNNEIKTSEIFEKLRQYISTTNERIQRPSVSLPGLIESFQSDGYVASVKRNLLEDAGTVSICVDTDAEADDYAEVRLDICNKLKDYVAAGMVFLGTEEEEITLSNGQQFDFKFFLPTYAPVLLRLNLTVSDNQVVTLPSDEVIRAAVLANIGLRYRLGWDFEPQRYYTLEDAPWAATILLEWSDDDGETWEDGVFEASFVDLFTFALEDIAVVIS